MNSKGFTLIELMVVVAIIAVIAGIAYPSYTNYITKSTRSAAHSMLGQTVNRQEQFFVDNKRYATTMTELGFGANPLPVGRDGSPSTADEAVYSVSITDTNGVSYTIVAVPQGNHAARDKECTELSLNHRGQRSAKGTKPDICWN